MKFKLGIVGHMANINKVTDIIDKYFEDIAPYPLEMINKEQIDDTVKFLYSHENFFDGVLYTGKIPFDVINLIMYHKVPWYYIEHSICLLKSALLEAILVHNYDIKKISIDSYDSSQLESTYSEIGILEGDFTYHIVKVDLTKLSMLDDMESFHESNYLSGRATLCITVITTIHENLTKKNIPCILIKPTEELIKKAIYEFRTKMLSNVISEAPAAFICIEIDQQSEYSLIYDNEYMNFIEKTKVSDEVFKFAQTLQSAAIDYGHKSYLIFTSKKMVEEHTSNLQEISLLKDIENNTEYTVSIGIGIGYTTREAKNNAYLAMQKSISRGGNMCYVLMNNSYFGPLISTPDSSKTNDILTKENYREIATSSGISIDLVYLLACAIEKNKKNTFTSKELSSELGNSQRSTNRLVEKLIDCNLAEIIGHKKVSGSGRPVRLIRINF